MMENPESVCNPIRGQHIQVKQLVELMFQGVHTALERTTTVGTLVDVVLRGQIGQRMLNGSINVKTGHVK